MSKGFTLIEICLAMLIMAGGVLTVVGLYALGFRENAQSAEDVVSAAFADAVMGPLVAAASATNLHWSAFREIKSYPEDGWRSYSDSDGLPIKNPTSVAEKVFKSAMGELGGSVSKPTITRGYEWGLVVLHEEGSGVIRIGFRATAKAGMLFAAPLYYTEVRFQGMADK